MVYNFYKKIFYCLLPFLIVLIVDFMDNFKGYKEMVLLLNGNEGVARITENPFYDISTLDELTDDNGDFDMDKFYYYILEKYPNQNKYLRFSYNDGNKIYTDSILYTNYVDSKWEGYLDDFLSTAIHKSVGSNFYITYYKDLAYPKSVALDLKRDKGYFGILKNYLLLWGVALFFSIGMFWSYFIQKK